MKCKKGKGGLVEVNLKRKNKELTKVKLKKIMFGMK